MEFFNPNSKIDFMGARKWTAIFSVIIFLISIGALCINGLVWGLDFTGGTQIQIHFPDAADLSMVRTKLAQIGFPEAVVTSYGTSKEILVTLVTKEKTNNVASGADVKELIVNQITHALPGAQIQQVDYIGPQVGKEMVRKGWFAIVIALLATMCYIAFRFELRFAVGSTLALIHDPILILGVFSFFHVEFNLIALAAVLTVIGYSLNDTIVIFDRVRENFRKLRKAASVEVMNQSINQTLSRTIMTSALTLTVVLALFFLGGSVLHGFALALIIGIVVGTYSSIYISGALAIALGLSRQHLLPAVKDTLDGLP